MESKGNFIDGEWRPAYCERFHSDDPATRSEVWTGHAATASEVDEAVRAACHAQPGWAKTTAEDRERSLRRFCETVRARRVLYKPLRPAMLGSATRTESKSYPNQNASEGESRHERRILGHI